MGSGVRARGELVSIAQGVFDISLELRAFDVVQAEWAFDPGVSRIAEPGSGVCRGDVIADLAQFVRGKRGICAGCGGHQAHMLANVVSESLLGISERPRSAIALMSVARIGSQVRIGGVVGEDDVDEESVVTEQLGRGVQGPVDRLLGSGHEPTHVIWRHSGPRREVDTYGDHGDVLAGCEAMATYVVGRPPPGVAGAGCRYRCGPTIDRRLVAEELAGSARLFGRCLSWWLVARRRVELRMTRKRLCACRIVARVARAARIGCAIFTGLIRGEGGILRSCRWGCGRVMWRALGSCIGAVGMNCRSSRFGGRWVRQVVRGLVVGRRPVVGIGRVGPGWCEGGGAVPGWSRRRFAAGVVGRRGGFGGAGVREGRGRALLVRREGARRVGGGVGGAVRLVPGRVGPPARELGACPVGFEVGEIVEIG